MTALGKLLRTTAFKLSAAYLVIFAIFAAVLLGYIAFNTRRLITEQVSGAVDAEIQGLAEQYQAGGVPRLVSVIDARTRLPGSSLYLLLAPRGVRLAGNVGRVAPEVMLNPGQRIIRYAHAEDDNGEHEALVRVFELPGGFRLLVGRDLSESNRLRLVIRRAFGWSLSLVVVLALLGGWFVTRRVLGRIDSMTDTTRGIMEGNLSGRLVISGTNDEFDRLARNLNLMLDRVEELMAGLKQVSDNVAHDLKTPLTRLRNGAEEALRTACSPHDYRLAMEKVIEEADNLIRVFNALLMIARAEAGNAREGMAEFDVAEVARDVAELYEPVAEEAGVSLTVEVPDQLRLFGSRELVGQAVANLVDNALKYAPVGKDGDGPPAVSVRAMRHDDVVDLVVADTGPGIPEADRTRVLDRFVRLENSRSRPGFGLGLSLAAAVAHLHGGALRLEDNGPGLRAVVSLPVRKGGG